MHEVIHESSQNVLFLDYSKNRLTVKKLFIDYKFTSNFRNKLLEFCNSTSNDYESITSIW